MFDPSDTVPVTDSPTAPANNGKVVLLICLAALGPYAWLTIRFNWVCDDAFISFRYARHLAEGQGLRYNIGADPVEGYSNFLWVLLLAPFEAIGWPAPIWSRVLSVACGVVLIWRVTRYLNRRFSLPAISLLLSALFLATLGPLAVWSTSGLATVPFALCFFFAFEALLGDPERVRGLLGGAACMGLVLLRADGFVFAAIVIGVTFVTALVERNKGAAKGLSVCVGLAVLALAAVIGFRLWYFGYPLPNTFYAKMGLTAMSLERGVKYVLCFLLTFPHLPIVLAASVVALLDPRAPQSVICQGAVITLGVFGYAAVVGGDFMAMGRFFVPALPFLTISFAAVVKRFDRELVVSRGCAVAAIILSLMPSFDQHVVPESVRREMHFRWNRAEFLSEYGQWELMNDRSAQWTKLGRAMKEHTKRGETYPTVMIGAVGYYSDLFIYDCSGLVNSQVAHRDIPRRRTSAGHDKGVNPAYFLKDKPTYFTSFLISESDLPDGQSPIAICGELFANFPPEVRRGYAPLTIPIKPADGSEPQSILLLPKRKDLIE